VAELVVQRAVAKPREAGFRRGPGGRGSIPGSRRRRACSAIPPTSVAEDLDLQQAFASYVLPIGSGVRLDAGKFVTSHGAR